MDETAARVYLSDGLDEARRGLWRSAAESFEAAAAAAPLWVEPVLAAAMCRLEHGDAAGAVVLLETAPAARVQLPEPGRTHHAWLRAAARLATGDLQGAEEAGEPLPERPWLRLQAHVHLQGGDYHWGLRALLSAYRRD